MWKTNLTTISYTVIQRISSLTLKMSLGAVSLNYFERVSTVVLTNIANNFYKSYSRSVPVVAYGGRNGPKSKINKFINGLIQFNNE